MPIRISSKMKEEVKKSLEEYNTTLSNAQRDPASVDLSEYVARVNFDGFEELKKEPEYNDIEVLTGERDAFQNIMLVCESADMAQRTYPKLSLEKYIAFVVELRIYKNVKRRKNVRDIQTAREFGDLSENAEYTIAKEQQAKIESRITELENIVNNCEIVEIKDSYDACDIGATVSIEGVSPSVKGKRKTFVLVGTYEGDINAEPQRLSNESPIGHAVMGKKMGENVIVASIKGKDIYRISNIK